eukprot:m.307688 g.307688  ORF g.307688 m.307688 type:complete len:333 (+) comp42633_c0_seq1:50-1048(+)
MAKMTFLFIFGLLWIEKGLVFGDVTRGNADWPLFESYEIKYNRHYASDNERMHRFRVFQASLKRIDARNAEDLYEPYGINIFSDLTPEEFSQRYLGYRPSNFNMTTLPVADLTSYSVRDLPDTYDWRNIKNVVTPVKNQGDCGSCWAFSAVENVESVWALQGKHPLTNLSVQQVVDCDKVDGGCEGGDTITAYQYILKAGGLESRANYGHYLAKDEKCHFNKNKIVAKIDGFEQIPKNESAMRVYLYNKAPLSICVDAITWQDYTGGVMKKHCGHALDHCVMITGYDMTGSVPYWIVRNSWGNKWGIDGYIHLEMFKDECGLAKEATSTYVN